MATLFILMKRAVRGNLTSTFGWVLKLNFCIVGDILYLGSNDKLLMKNVAE